MRKYEVMYILKADLDEAKRNEAIEKINAVITDNGGKIENVDTKMGLRNLAYPINDETKGFYVVIKMSAERDALEEFERLIKLNTNVLRHLTLVD